MLYSISKELEIETFYIFTAGKNGNEETTMSHTCLFKLLKKLTGGRGKALKSDT